MSRSRRSVLGGLAGMAAATSLLAACGRWPGAGPAGDEAPAPVPRVVELRTHARASGERDGYRKNVEAFNERHAGRYHATFEPIVGDLYQGQETLMAGGTAGDLHYAQLVAGKFLEYAVRGVAVPLDPFVARDREFTLAAWPPRAQEALRAVDQKVFGLPLRGQVEGLVLFWNRDLLRRAGVPEPAPDWTFDALLDAARRLKRPEAEIAPSDRELASRSPGAEFVPIIYLWGFFSLMVGHVRRFGGEFFDPPNGPGRRCTLDAPACLRAMRWFYDQTRAGLMAPPRGDPFLQFAGGEAAFLFGVLAADRANVARLVGTNFDWTFDLVPKGPTGRRGGFLSLDTQQINAGSGARDGAWELLKWLTSRESGVNLALQQEGSLTPGFRKDVYCDPRVVGDPRFPPSAMRANCAVVDEPEGFSYPHNLRQSVPGGIEAVVQARLRPIAQLAAGADAVAHATDGAGGPGRARAPATVASQAATPFGTHRRRQPHGRGSAAGRPTADHRRTGGSDPGAGGAPSSACGRSPTSSVPVSARPGVPWSGSPRSAVGRTGLPRARARGPRT